MTGQRGMILHGADDMTALATVHPASVLRAPDEATRAFGQARLVEDLSKVAAYPA